MQGNLDAGNQTLIDVEHAMEEYLDLRDWRIQANANQLIQTQRRAGLCGLDDAENYNASGQQTFTACSGVISEVAENILKIGKHMCRVTL